MVALCTYPIQIELYRSSDPDHSLGVWVIAAVRKTSAIAPTQYLLQSRETVSGSGSGTGTAAAAEGAKWTTLKRSMSKSGKPFRLLRKVF